LIHKGTLFHNLTLFGHILHQHGLDVDTDQIVDLSKALEFIPITNKRDFYYAARVLFVNRQPELIIFDRIFEEFWRSPQGRLSRTDAPIPSQQKRRRNAKPTLLPISPGIERLPIRDKDEDLEIQANLTYSPQEILRQKDFSALATEETDQVRESIESLVLFLGDRKSRRWRSRGKQMIDFRQSLRRSMQSGGIHRWMRLDPKFKPRSAVILADISGSMKLYTEMFLYFIQTLTASQPKTEAFVFATRLTRITQSLEARQIHRAVSTQVPDWSGGTRIGEAIKTFNYRWSRRVLHPGDVVLLVSDGWDRGDVELLRKEIARLQRNCYRLIWLNPLLASQNYEPLTRGMMAALPFVDDFLPIHNLASLEQLARHLRTLPLDRPIRRQHRRVEEAAQ
jgi:uncharacterized protein with von Willebrand factor type A (vWA) domain